MNKLLLQLSLISGCLFGCKSIQQKTVKQELSLSQKEYKIIKNDKEIIDGIYGLINDSIDIKKIKAPLDDFYVQQDKKQFMVTLEMYSVFGNQFTIGKLKLDSTNTTIPRIGSIEALKAFKERMNKEKEAAKKAFNEKYKRKDSVQ